jgi:hypothetical protein
MEMGYLFLVVVLAAILLKIVEVIFNRQQKRKG